MHRIKVNVKGKYNNNVHNNTLLKWHSMARHRNNTIYIEIAQKVELKPVHHVNARHKLNISMNSTKCITMHTNVHTHTHIN